MNPMASPDRGRRSRDILREHRSRILSFVSDRGGRDVRVFGSLARGDDDPQSDIDLLIELPDGVSAGDELLTALGLSEELSQLSTPVWTSSLPERSGRTFEKQP
jgi:hypothetical protein